ncbi:MAG TPA: nitroreductase family protein [Candidatus Binataceae bacterium]|nr:nitroreductase family protein [Candidatus Binataceae bacterium]
MAETGLFEVMYSAGAIRRLRPDPVPDEVITKVLDAAIRAPSGSNAQSWLFMVVKDAGKRKQLGAVYKKASEILMKLYAGAPRPEHMDEKKYARFMQSVQHLFDHMGDAPVLLVPCLKASMWSGSTNLPADIKARMAGSVRIAGSSIYPAVQNIILACRAFGLGTVLTTIHAFFEEEVRAILNLPADVQTYALMPIGYPQGHHFPVKRKAVKEVACLDSYGKAWPG